MNTLLRSECLQCLTESQLREIPQKSIIIFLCKCKMFCENFQVPRFTGVLVHK